MAFILTPFGRVPPSRAIDKPAVAFLPATAGTLTSDGAGAGKIADWSIAGRIGEGQPVPRFGSVARSSLTGRGSDGRPVQFLDTSAVLRARSCAITPVSVKFVRARLAGLPGLARVAAHRVARIAVRVSEQVQLLCFGVSPHVHEHGVREFQDGRISFGEIRNV